MSVSARLNPNGPSALQVPTSLLSDGRFRKLTAAQQHTFLMLCLRPENNALGTLPLLAGRFAYATDELTALDVLERMRELALAGWLTIDESWDEVFIPRFMEFNLVTKNPNRLKAAIALAEEVESPLLRAKIGEVLARIDRVAAQQAARQLAEPAPRARPRNRPNISGATRLAVYQRDGWACVYCARPFDPAPSGAPEDQSDGVWLELDHIAPYSLGGDDSFDNLRAACSTCNRRRGVDDLDLWAEKIGVS